MDDPLSCQFFSQPVATWHRRYEALRAYFIDKRSLPSIAEQFGYRLSALKSIVCRFRASCNNGTPPPFSFQMPVDDHPVADAVKINRDRNQPPSQTAGS
jgi:hypothetical protein